MEVYFDNSATTRVLESAADIVVRTMTGDYGNPSSRHQKGVEAERYIKEAANIIAKTLKVQDKEILFTSGGSESNNLALIGAAFANQRMGKHMITTVIEHPSVHRPMQYLEEQGFDVTYLKVDRQGHIDLEELKNSIRKDTILVSIMYVNNETGALEPISEIGSVIKRTNANTLFHVDGIQAYGKYNIYPKKLNIDLMSVSGHKIHGPKGVGFLYIAAGVKLKPLIYGGGQQQGRRSGTENVPGVAGLGEAVRELYKNHDQKTAALYELKDYMIERVSELAGVTVNSQKGLFGAPQIVSVSFSGIRSEVLLHALEERGIYVSSGSACSANHQGISSTLKEIGIKQELLESTVRFSFGVFNAKEEIDYTIGVLSELLPVLRRYRRG